MQFRKSAFEKIEKSAFGVYGLWYRDCCIYVGKAEDQPIAVRLEQHWTSSHNEDLQAWIQAKGAKLKVAIKVISDKKRINVFERFCIYRFQPLTNKQKYRDPVVPHECQ